MKKLALAIIIGIAGVALNAEEYTIQTISAKKEKSITPAFEKKVRQSALSSSTKKEGSCNIVTVGRYDSAKKARADLAKARAIAQDAFVRPVTRTVPKACATLAAKTKQEKVLPSDANATVTASLKTDVVAEKSKDRVFAESSKEVNDAVKKSESAGEVSHTTVYIYDRNLARKSDIHDAIEYYKNSPYHTFKPVAMQR